MHDKEIRKILMNFCGNEEEFDIDKPFVRDKLWIATDRRIIVCVSTTAANSEGKRFPGVANILQSVAEINVNREWPSSMRSLVRCNLGHEHDSDRDDEDCIVRLGDTTFDRGYVDKITKFVPGPLWYGTNSEKLLVDNRNGWRVILMAKIWEKK